MGFRLDGRIRRAGGEPALGHHGKGLPLTDQARPALRGLLLTFAAASLAACVGSTESPSDLWKNINSDGVEGRPMPPGGHGPYPTFGKLPARPTPPSPEARAAVDAELQRARAEAAEPLVSNGQLPPPPTGTPGQGQVPINPPVAASLPPAPPVSWRSVNPAAPQPGPVPSAPALTQPAPPAIPDAPPEAPPAELTTPPPPPRL
ncbi:hypothetical protein IAI18_16740 [Acetobacteraceae bacterium H6797]|nr:hypothetical protein [Acetobacteraceae bacterium H6797]